SQNMIIHGDNLLALKSLLPRYEGKVKCIYIDPPYNTGNEGWVYNDNVNDPQIQKWLGDVVGKEGEDFTRHDKWLCMMYPRLMLLQKLLAEDGAIFISIDDNELYNLKHICDEIFGNSCFVANISWQRTYSTRNDSKGIVSEAEHIIVYSKQPGWQPNKLPRTAEMDKKYKNPDGDFAKWRSDNAYAPGAVTHQGMVYAIQHPFTGEMLYPTVSSCWRYEQAEMLRIMNGWCPYELRDIGDAARRAEVCGVPEADVRKDVKAIVLSQSLDESRKLAEQVQKKGPWPRFFFSRNGLGGIARKTYLDKVGAIPPTNLWEYKDVGHTDEAKKELMALFGGKSPFDTPKPTRLVERILKIATDKDSIVLDSFAGSGTTAHAVLNANKADGGKRTFILVEMMDYADSVTAERVKRVIQGYGRDDKRVEGTGGDFSYYELGPELMKDGVLNEEAGAAAIRDYVWYTETRGAGEKAAAGGGDPYLLGTAFGVAYYFCYERGEAVTLNRALLRKVKTKAESYVIYADICTLGAAELERYHITFKKIPRDITRF
ncbi:MAG: site-specific DNA-methyltransferase, partial [Kiritimatiellia bacterium]